MQAPDGHAPTGAYSSWAAFCNLTPDMEKLKAVEGLLLQVTVAGSEVDCVSRTFAPKLNVAEDPVCGSGHCHIAPYWAKKLNKKNIIAYQASERGGTLFCRLEDDRVKLAGKVALYSISDTYINETPANPT